MTSERALGVSSGRGLRFVQRAARLGTASLLCGALSLLLLTSAGCVEDEDFKCCECTFPTCVDGDGVPAPQDLCACTRPFTYEECGLFCRDQAPTDLYNQGFRSCGAANNSMAKNSCSIGSPVGKE